MLGIVPGEFGLTGEALEQRSRCIRIRDSVNVNDISKLNQDSGAGSVTVVNGVSFARRARLFRGHIKHEGGRFDRLVELWLRAIGHDFAFSGMAVRTVWIDEVC